MYNAEYLYQIGVITMLTEYTKWYCIAIAVLGVVALIFTWNDKP